MRLDWVDAVIRAFVGLLIVIVVGGIAYVIYYEVNDPGHGKVTEKKYHGAYWTTNCSGKPLVCTTYFTPECYGIYYNDGHHDGDACVSPEEYDDYEVGSYFPKGWKP